MLDVPRLGDGRLSTFEKRLSVLLGPIFPETFQIPMTFLSLVATKSGIPFSATGSRLTS